MRRKASTCSSRIRATSYTLWPPAAAGFRWRAGASSLVAGMRCSLPRARSIDLRILVTTYWYGWSFTVPKAVNVGAKLRMVVLVLGAMVWQAGAGQAAPQPAPQQPPPPAANESSDQIASHLLQQLGQAL